MKKIMIITAVGLLAAQCGFAQNRHEPPSSVRESFQKDYPRSQPGNWSHSSTGWSVSFDDRDNDNGNVTAHFDTRGRHTDTYIRYDGNDVPNEVSKAIHNRYPDAMDYRYTCIERPRGEVYEATFRSHGRTHTMYLDGKGHETGAYGARR